MVLNFVLSSGTYATALLREIAAEVEDVGGVEEAGVPQESSDLTAVENEMKNGISTELDVSGGNGP
jgi:hypothetical protein